MKKEDIIKKLEELGVGYDPKAKKTELEVLLKEELKNSEEEVVGDEGNEEEEEEKKPQKNLGYLGTKEVKIVVLKDVKINGRPYKEVTTADGCTYRMSEKELKDNLVS